LFLRDFYVDQVLRKNCTVGGNKQTVYQFALFKRLCGTKQSSVKSTERARKRTSVNRQSRYCGGKAAHIAVGFFFGIVPVCFSSPYG